MNVTCEIVGGERRDLELDPGATYGDLLDAVGFSPREATALVDGAPVPDDRPVDAEEVRVLRLIKGG